MLANWYGSDNETNREITAEEMTVYAGKKLGDWLEFIDPRGKKVQATCQEYNDHLVAVHNIRRI